MLRSMNRERQQEPSPSPEIRRVAVVGAGTIGSGWATLFASKGLSVTLFDADPEAARAAADVVAATLRFLDQHGLLDGTSVEEAEDALRIATTLEDAVEQVHLVQEAVFESYEAKRMVFAALDAATPASVLLASSSSGLLMSEIQQGGPPAPRALPHRTSHQPGLPHPARGTRPRGADLTRSDGAGPGLLQPHR
jgi:carnitine 3-dehydrogenase